MDTCFTSFVKACQAYFGDVTIPEFKALSAQDKLDLSAMLNAEPSGKFTHPAYEPKVA